jgi:pseudaminic acid cytidylyltransferase
MSKKLAIIPARGGSKRIPRKNVKSFLGKPIISYAIETAKMSGLFDEVMVSTDDIQIAKIAEQHGASVPFMRSAGAASDHATTFDVIEEVLVNYQKIGIQYKFGCCIYPATPLLSCDTILKAYKLLITKKYDIVFPVMKFGFPIQRAIRITSKSRASMVYPEYLTTRSQDLEPRYHDAGQFYWFDNDIILEERKILTQNTGTIELSELEGQDIDNESDWVLAEMKFKLLHNIKEEKGDT